MSEEPLGYICDECHGWIATLAEEAVWCGHPRIRLVENCSPAQVEAAKALSKARQRRGHK